MSRYKYCNDHHVVTNIALCFFNLKLYFFQLLLNTANTSGHTGTSVNKRVDSEFTCLAALFTRSVRIRWVFFGGIFFNQLTVSVTRFPRRAGFPSAIRFVKRILGITPCYTSTNCYIPGIVWLMKLDNCCNLNLL